MGDQCTGRYSIVSTIAKRIRLEIPLPPSHRLLLDLQLRHRTPRGPSTCRLLIRLGVSSEVVVRSFPYCQLQRKLPLLEKLFNDLATEVRKLTSKRWFGMILTLVASTVITYPVVALILAFS